ncbi:glutathione S-transferase 1-like [Limulus polyphemus]|uniref:Glutathione S-transferase 1-like n=1 Tax=Limulus polyphemus TaxID=6850 RepID=A0ABM1B9P7_LIMPO|nr:glutathione S-transferase 1-like [Limulus polyphemus]
MTVDLYHMAASGPCRAVRMVAELISVNLNLKDVDILAGEQNKPEFLKMNPQHCVPTIDDDGFYLWESRAIMQYLINKYAPDSSLYPKDPRQRAMVDMMLYFDMGTLYKTQGELFYPQAFKGEAPDPEKESNYKTALGYLETYLTKTSYVAGDKLTLADISVVASLSMMEVLDYDFQSFPKLYSWMAKMKKEIPNYKTMNDEPLEKFKAWVKSNKNQ